MPKRRGHGDGLRRREQCPATFSWELVEEEIETAAHNPVTVDRHFRWMRGMSWPASSQRFTAGLHNPPILGFRDAVARNVRAAAESNGRVFAIMYAISGNARETVVGTVKRDWIRVGDDLRLIESPRYLRHNARPLLAIWGFGFTDRAPTPAQAAELIDFFKNPEPPYRVTLLGGVPARWRTLTRDSQPDPSWARIYGPSTSSAHGPSGAAAMRTASIRLRGRSREGCDRNAPPRHRVDAGRVSWVLLAQYAPHRALQSDSQARRPLLLAPGGARGARRQHDDVRRNVRRSGRRHGNVQGRGVTPRDAGRAADGDDGRGWRAAAERLVSAVGARGPATVVPSRRATKEGRP